MNLINDAVERFNNLPADQRTIAPNDVYIMEVVYYRPITTTWVGRFDGERPDEVDSSGALYVGRAKYLWVGARGADLTATRSSFLLISEEVAPARRPEYVMEELVFNFPTFNGDLSSRNGGNNMVFCPFKSAKGLVFDTHMDINVTYNPYYSDSNLGTGGATLQLKLMYDESFGAPVPVLNGLVPNVVNVSIDLQTMTASWTVNSMFLYQNAANEDGLKGTFYWIWTSDNFAAVDGAQIHELSLTLTVLSPTPRFDMVGILPV